MERYLREFKSYISIYILIIFGFSLFMLSTTNIFSLLNQYKKGREVKYNGNFKYVYSLNIKQCNDISFKNINELSKELLNNCSILTSDEIQGDGEQIIIGIFNYDKWSPKILKNIDSPTIKSDSIILGKALFHDKTQVEIDSQTYNVGAIAGLNEGRSIYDYKIYIPLDLIPNNMELMLKSNNEINLLVRCDDNIKNKLNTLTERLKNINPNVEVSMKRMNFEYFIKSITTGGAKEVFSFPLRVLLVASINGFIIIYFFNYVQRKKIALEKAFGATNLRITITIFYKLLLCIIPATIISIILTSILIKLNFKAVVADIVLNISSVIFGIVCTAILCIATSFISYFNISKMKPIDILK